MASDADDEKKAIGAKRWIVWLLLSSLGSVALLAITNQICQEITVVPLLWIVPLSIYLLTFIISFDRPQWFAPRWWGVATASTILAMCLYRSDFLWMVDHVIDMVGVPFSFRELYGDFVFEIFIYCLTLFLVCMTCHGELVRSKPEPHRLTSFYLAMSMGGALGGVFVAVFCPLLFSTFFETELVLAGGLLVAVLLIATDGSRHWSLSKGSIRLRAAIVLLAGMDLIVATVWLGDSDNAILRTRNFYGVLTVDLSETDNGEPGRSLYHGRTLHGFQFISNHLRREPTTYFSRESGVGVTLTALSQQEPLHVGVVGLGVGTVATYGRQGDLYHFYEINEDVIELAETSFSFLKDSAAEIKITRGDARVSLERQPQQEFDVLALDAFSGDGIPVHLLTAEAFLIYLKHISPNGVIAVHVTNRYVNLFPVISQIADQYGMEMIHIATSYDDDTVADSSSDWLMLTYDKGFAKHKLVQQHLTILEEDHARIVWTDQFSSLLSVMK